MKKTKVAFEFLLEWDEIFINLSKYDAGVLIKGLCRVMDGEDVVLDDPELEEVFEPMKQFIQAQIED